MTPRYWGSVTSRSGTASADSPEQAVSTYCCPILKPQTRYEVEIQLGPTDESHIIRTIEYWEIERRRYPQYEHVAVIVAEDVTSRFLNVINLLNGSVTAYFMPSREYAGRV